MDKRKLFALIGLIVGTIGIGLAIYFVFFRPSPPPEVVTPGPTGPSGTLQLAEGTRTLGETTIVTSTAPGLPASQAEPAPVASGGPTRTTELVPAGATNMTFEGGAGTVQYYDPQTGLFHRILPDGTNVTLNDSPLPSARDVTWSNASDKAIVEFPDGRNILYDFNTKEQRSLPAHWTEFSFAPSDSSIAAKKIGISPESRYLVTANPDGTGERNIEFLGQNASKVQVSWSPNDQIIAFSHTGQKLGLGREEVLAIGKNNENFKSLIVEGLGFQPKWSPKGDILLYSSFSSSNNLQPELWIVNSNPDTIGQNRQPIGVTTWAEKCTFADNTTIYCAVPDPNRLPYGIGFQPKLANNTNDSIYKLDLLNGRTTLVGKPDNTFTIEQIVVAQDQSALYFTDKNTGSLQQMQLK